MIEHLIALLWPALEPRIRALIAQVAAEREAEALKLPPAKRYMGSRTHAS